MRKTKNHFILGDYNQLDNIVDSGLVYVNLKRNTNSKAIFIRAKIFHTFENFVEPNYTPILSEITSQHVDLELAGNLNETRNPNDVQVLNLYLHLNKSVADQDYFIIKLIGQNKTIEYQIRLPHKDIYDGESSTADLERELTNSNYNLNSIHESDRNDLFNFNLKPFEHEHIYHVFRPNGSSTNSVKAKIKFFHVLKGFGINNAVPVPPPSQPKPLIKENVTCGTMPDKICPEELQVVEFAFNVNQGAQKSGMEVKLEGDDCGNIRFSPLISFDKSFESTQGAKSIRVITRNCDILIPPVP